MARVKSAMTTRARHKKVLKQAKGYYGAKHYRFRNANQAVLKSLSYAYVGRKDRKSKKYWGNCRICYKHKRLFTKWINI